MCSGCVGAPIRLGLEMESRSGDAKYCQIVMCRLPLCLCPNREGEVDQLVKVEGQRIFGSSFVLVEIGGMFH